MRIHNLKFGNLLIVVIAVQIVTHIAIVLDIAVARQVIGFLYLVFVPGVVLFKMLKFRNLGLGESFVLSVGLSLAFLMFIGLLANELFPAIGVSEPLSLWPLIFMIDIIVLLMCLLGCIANREDFNINIPLAASANAFRIAAFVILPIISVAGAVLMNLSGNNFFLLFTIVIISVWIVLGALSDRFLPSRFYSLVLLMIAVALLFHASLISNYITGYDINIEYYCFRLTHEYESWGSITSLLHSEYPRVNAMLSVTVLPTIFANILNLPATWILKIVYPLIFSFVPLCVFELCKEQVGKRFAFVSTFFFMANSMFFTEMLALTREMVAELYFALLFFVLLSKKIDSRKRSILFIIFSAALAVSHYGLSYIFMFYVFSTWLFLTVLKKRTAKITATFVVASFVIPFLWFIYVSESAPFNGLISMGNNVFESIFTEFFSPESRGRDVMRGLGLEAAPSLMHSFSRIFAYTTQFLIVVGFIGLMYTRQLGQKKKSPTQESSMFLSLSIAILILCIALPGFASSLRMTRFYHTVLILLSPLCILGVETLIRLFGHRHIKTESYVLVLVLTVLVPYFFFQTGFFYEVTGDTSWSIPLSKYRAGLIPYASGLIDEQDVFGAVWLSEKMNTEGTLIYADDMSKYTVLTSYGLIKRDQIEILSNITIVQANDAIYLRKVNLFFGVLFKRRGDIENLWNITEISPVFSDMNKVYSSGQCEIYKAMSDQTE